jgi:hypothetical protein
MAYSFRDGKVGMQPIATTETVQKHELGTRVLAWDPLYGTGEFVYALGVASTIVGSVAAIDDKAGTTTLTVAATRGPVGVAMSANVAAQYGWYQIRGAAVLSCNAAVAAQARVYSTATAGKVDDAVVAGSAIDGAVFKTADGTPSANLAVAEIAFPCMNGNG